MQEYWIPAVLEVEQGMVKEVGKGLLLVQSLQQMRVQQEQVLC